MIVPKIVSLDTDIHNLTGKYIKLVLTELEGTATITPQQRKIILDHFNEFSRDVLILLGYKVE